MSMTTLHLAVRRPNAALQSSPLFVAFLALWSLLAHGQQPTAQQQNAIRQSCRGDFQANCSGVPTGGSEALQCLKENFAKASPGCQKALSPVMGAGGAAPPGGTAPGAAPAGSASSQPVPPSKAPAAAGPGGQGAMSRGQPLTMREEVMLTREMCGAEFRSYCSNVPLGGGRAIQCLEANAGNLSPRCKAALADIRARR